MLYNTGTIAINGNTATGTGTNWTAPASQVRAGQTIIVMSNPVQMFQISSVNSATSMTVTPAASPALSGQKYGILVSDITSIDGLAQAMSQLIKEYDENIGAWETFATTSANQSITVTINGNPVTIPGIGKLAQKGSNGALSIDQGGTGATTAESARSNLGLAGAGNTSGKLALIGNAKTDTNKCAVIVKTGSNANGKYRIWSDGSIDMWGNGIANMNGDALVNYPFALPAAAQNITTTPAALSTGTNRPITSVMVVTDLTTATKATFIVKRSDGTTSADGFYWSVNYAAF